MSREIKFRAWDKRIKAMREVINIEGLHRFMILEVRIPGTKEYYEIEDENDFILMQYTGLCDKDGKEIYEGDILRHTEGGCGISKVVWHDLGFYYLWWEDEWRNQDTGEFEPAHWQHTKMYWSDSGLEIIGNICESPELLEGGNGNE